VRVRLVLEGDYLRASRARSDPFEPGGAHEPNLQIYAACQRARMEVRTDYNAAIFHQKFIVRDSHGGNTGLLMGSTNFTPTGTDENLNHVIITEDKGLTGEYQAEFDEIWGGTFGDKRLRHDPAPRNNRISGVRVKALFAPDHAPEMEIMKQMLKARERIDFAVFTFARSSGIDDTMAALARSGIIIRGIIDGAQGGQHWAPTNELAAAGCDIHLSRNVGALNKLHHKLMVIDGKVIIAGSFNYTEPATRLNDENILVIGEIDETNVDGKARQSQLAGAARDEIDRIIETHGEPVGA
jgi:phosphatidylserine/phosphatidylglycerophosphate/cardiolipin synthase-like enzyme